MRPLLLFFLTVTTFLIPALAQNYDNAGMDYTKAIYENKTPADRINALNEYLKIYTDTTNNFVKLAYYSLATNYFENKDYGKAIEAGEKRLTMGEFGEGEEARLHLVLANSYAIKSTSFYNKEKAMQHVNIAIRVAEANQDQQLVTAANNLKGRLTAPVTPKMSPEQQIKLHYQNEDYSQAISFYGTLGASDKSNPEIHKVYAFSLFKANRLDQALSEFKTMYGQDKSGSHASRIADIYVSKAAKNRNLYQEAVNYFLEAGWLFHKEEEFTKKNTAFRNAKYYLFEKHGYNSELKRVENLIRQDQANAQRNQEEVRKQERELRKLEREIERDYADMEPPKYVTDKLQDLKDKIANLKSGVSTKSTAEAEALEKKKKDIEQEFDTLQREIKQRLGVE